MFSIQEANPRQLSEWDNFIDTSINGTLFHKINFLKYHENKFTGKERHLVVLNGDALYAQISLTIENIDGNIIAKSPYGASYGGFIFQLYPTYGKGNELINEFIRYLKQKNVNQFLVTHPIACCSEYPLDTFYFNLVENGFTSVNRDISSVFCFDKKFPVVSKISKRAGNAAGKSEKSGICIKRNSDVNDFWYLMEKTFTKHGASPTHTLQEFVTLLRRAPDSIYFDVAYLEMTPIAGIAYFVLNNRVNSSFYFCQDPDYQQFQGLSYLIVKALQMCEKDGYIFFDFGTSTRGMKARESIFTFKESYSKIGFFRETFKWQSAE